MAECRHGLDVRDCAICSVEAAYGSGTITAQEMHSTFMEWEVEDLWDEWELEALRSECEDWEDYEQHAHHHVYEDYCVDCDVRLYGMPGYRGDPDDEGWQMSDWVDSYKEERWENAAD